MSVASCPVSDTATPSPHRPPQLTRVSRTEAETYRPPRDFRDAAPAPTCLLVVPSGERKMSLSLSFVTASKTPHSSYTLLLERMKAMNFY